MMKGKLLKWVSITAALCILGFVMMGATVDSETAAVKKLLERRTMIMENVLFGNITYEEGASQLKEVEMDKLYSDDLRSLAEYRNTDIESVRKMDIIDIKKESQIYDIMTFSCEINWTYSGIDGTDEITGRYVAGVDRNGGDLRLVSFSPAEASYKK